MSRNATVATAFLAIAILWGDVHAQTVQPVSQKQLLIAVLQDLRAHFQAFRESPGASRDAGKALRESLQLMLGATRRRGTRSRPDVDLILAVSEDLGIKRDHCRLKGLSADQEVAVKTKRRG